VGSGQVGREYGVAALDAEAHGVAGGGLPFESAEFTLPRDSQLVLYTDGLIEDRNRDIDIGLDMLRDALQGPGRTPEEMCQAVLDTMLSARPNDDIALLVARSRLLDPSQVADWDVPGDPPPSPGSEPRSLAGWKSGDWRSSPSPPNS
jgi:hypothetical protein